MKRFFLVLLVMFALCGSVFAHYYEGNIIAYYPLNNLTDMQNATHSLTTYGSPTTTTGKNGLGYSVTGSGSSGAGGNNLNLTYATGLANKYFDKDDNYCFSYWVNYGTRQNGGYTTWSASDYVSTVFPFASYGGITINNQQYYSSSYATGNTAEYLLSNDANFHHYLDCYRSWNTTTAKLQSWEDGVLKLNQSHSKTATVTASPIVIGIGAPASHKYGMSGTHIFDEFLVVNVSSSQAFANSMYNSGAGCFFSCVKLLFEEHEPFVQINGANFQSVNVLTNPKFQIKTNSSYPINASYTLKYFANNTLVNKARYSTNSLIAWLNITLPRNNTMYKLYFNYSYGNDVDFSPNYTLIMFGNTYIVNNYTQYLQDNNTVYSIVQSDLIETYNTPSNPTVDSSFTFFATTKFATFCKFFLNNEMIYQDSVMQSSRSISVQPFENGINSFYWYCDLQKNTNILNLTYYEYDKTTPFNFTKTTMPSTIQFNFESVSKDINDYQLYLVSPCIKRDGVRYNPSSKSMDKTYSSSSVNGSYFRQVVNGQAQLTLANNTYEFCLINGAIQYSSLNQTKSFHINEFHKQVYLGVYDIPSNITQLFNIQVSDEDLYGMLTPEHWSTSWTMIITNVLLIGFGTGVIILGGATGLGSAIVVGAIMVTLGLGFSLLSVIVGVTMG